MSGESDAGNEGAVLEAVLGTEPAHAVLVRLRSQLEAEPMGRDQLPDFGSEQLLGNLSRRGEVSDPHRNISPTSSLR